MVRRIALMTLSLSCLALGCTAVNNPALTAGETGAGDGDGDPTSGDGDGDPTTGDGDGDGDGDPTTSDPTTGDGDGDPTTGDGDGDGELCGNGVIEQGEECDGDNFAGVTCEQLGYGGGELLCQDDCVLDESNCIAACVEESDCSGLKPNVAFIFDYSTSMNIAFDGGMTRWESILAALGNHVGPQSWLSDNTHLMLLHFGHDPSPMDGTLIQNEPTFMVDGHLVDLPWYEMQVFPWYECSGGELLSRLENAGPPMNGMQFGIGTWTRGALLGMQNYIAQSKTAHPQDGNARPYINVLLTDGLWTGVDGTTPLSPASESPVLTAVELLDDGVPTYVIVVDDNPDTIDAAHGLASAGGTVEAFVATNNIQLNQALISLGDELAALYDPDC